MFDSVTVREPIRLSATHRWSDDFVAERRPSSRQNRYVDSASQLYDPGAGSRHLHSKISRDDDLETALNCLLSNKSFSTEQLSKVMHGMVVKLITTLLKGHAISQIQGCISVSLGDSGHTITVDLNERYSWPQEACCGLDATASDFEVQGKAVSPVKSPVSDERTCMDDCAHFGVYSPPISSPEIPSLKSPPGLLEENDILATTNDEKIDGLEQADSEEDSGYSGSERESVYDVCSDDTTDNSGTLYKQFYRSDTDCLKLCKPMDTEEVEQEESKLIIDLSASSEDSRKTVFTEETNPEFITPIKSEMRATSEEKVDNFSTECTRDADVDDDMERNSRNSSPNLNGETAGGDKEGHAPNSRSDGDDDAPIDLSGDCLVAGSIQSAQETDKQHDLTDSTELTCKKCGVKLSDSTQYQEHALQFHQLYACSTCHKDFSSKNNLKRHVRIHTGSRPYKCVQCDMTFARKDDLKGHTLKHDYSKPFRCSLCKKGYTDRACVKNHMTRAHRSQLLHICPECGESFDKDDAYLEHKKSHPSLKQFTCKICPYVGTNHLMAMKHQLLHSHKLFSCKPCNAYFSDPFAYTKHIRVHKKRADYKSYVCCFCDVVLPTYDQFVRHEYSHLQGKLHECNTCKKQFRNKSLMLEHSLLHTVPKTESQEQQCTAAACTDSHDVVHAANDAGCPMDEEDVSESRDISIESTQFETRVGDLEDRNENETSRQDPFEGELLDLTMKQPASDHPNAKASPMTQVPIHGSRSLSTKCVPRNGYAAIETPIHSKVETSNVVGCHTAHGGNDCENAEECQVVLKKSAPFKGKADVESTYDRRQSHLDEEVNEQRDTAHLQGHPHKSTVVNQNSRFHPYSKMMDLASKFLAARGSISKSTSLRRDQLTGASVHLRKAIVKQSIQEKLLANKSGSEMNALRLSRETSPVATMTQNTVFGLSGKPYITGCTVEEHTPLKKELPDFSTTSSPSSDVLPSFSKHSPMLCSSQAVTSPSPSTSEDKPQVCDICHVTFPSFYHLESHSVVEHSRYLCEFCGKAFTARPNRDRHVRYHTGERPYKCDQCPCAFFRGDDLKYHRTTRHPTEQISCTRCSASFTWPKDLERHLRHSKCVI